MRSGLAIGLFAVAVLAFFLLGRLEHRHASGNVSDVALSAARNSIEFELSKEQTGHPSSPAERSAFLIKQKRLLSNPHATLPQAHEEVPSPQQPVGKSSDPAFASYMPVILTSIIGLLAIWMIVSTANKPDDEGRKWAFGVLGVIVGFWLKG